MTAHKITVVGSIARIKAILTWHSDIHVRLALNYLENLVQIYYDEHKDVRDIPTCDVADVFGWISETRRKFLSEDD